MSESYFLKIVMPRKETVARALRRSQRRYLINKSRKHKIKLVVKKFKRLLSGKKYDEAKQNLALVYKEIDKAAKKFWHKNKAARLKSRLTKLLVKNIV